jgi:hypothetical protein
MMYGRGVVTYRTILSECLPEGFQKSDRKHSQNSWTHVRIRNGFLPAGLPLSVCEHVNKPSVITNGGMGRTSELYTTQKLT